MADLKQLLPNINLATWLSALLGFLALVYWLGIRSYTSVLGHSALPAPRIWPWVGNLPDIFKYGGLHKMLLNYFYKYGRVYKMCLGRSPSIVVTDPEIIKQITVKEFWKFTNRPPFVKPNPPLNSGLFIARDETWRRIRHTLTPTFTASKLKHIVPIIENASEKLKTKMQKYAETGAFLRPVVLYSIVLSSEASWTEVSTSNYILICLSSLFTLYLMHWKLILREERSLQRYEGRRLRNLLWK